MKRRGPGADPNNEPSDYDCFEESNQKRQVNDYFHEYNTNEPSRVHLHPSLEVGGHFAVPTEHGTFNPAIQGGFTSWENGWMLAPSHELYEFLQPRDNGHNETSIENIQMENLSMQDITDQQKAGISPGSDAIASPGPPIKKMIRRKNRQMIRELLKKQ